MMSKRKKSGAGFTLLELLIVIAIIAILAVALIIVLNPAETLRKSRDVQRISDLNTMKNAIGIYTTTVTPVFLASATTNTGCKTGASPGAYGVGIKIWYSYPSTAPGAAITDTLLDGSILANQPIATQATAAAGPLTDGTGWLPIKFDNIAGGSPISNLPIDPINTVTVAAVARGDFVYRYACLTNDLSYEMDATLESNAYTVDEDKELKDGGNANDYYEVGTNLKLMGATPTGVDY